MMPIFRYSTEVRNYGPEKAGLRSLAAPGQPIDKVFLCIMFDGGHVHKTCEEVFDITVLWRDKPEVAGELAEFVALALRNAEEAGRRDIQFGLRELLGAAREEGGL